MGSKLIKFGIKPGENEQIEAIVKVPKEPRSVIHGIVKDHKGKLVKDAVVKLFEMIHPPCKMKALTHTFTDECGQFLFGPLCPNKHYVIKVWIDNVKIKQLNIEPDPDDPCDHICKEDDQKNEYNEEYLTDYDDE